MEKAEEVTEQQIYVDDDFKKALSLSPKVPWIGSPSESDSKKLEYVKQGWHAFLEYKSFPFRPLHNQVVIRVLREKEFQGSLVLPESANDNKQHGAIGIVVAKGVGHRRKSLHATQGPKPERQWLGGYCELPVQPGDHVLFARSSGEAHTFGGESFLVTPIEHVMAVLDDYDTSGRAIATEREFGLESSMDKKWSRPASERPVVTGRTGQ